MRTDHDALQRGVRRSPSKRELSLPKSIRSDIMRFKGMVAEHLAAFEPFDLPFFIGRVALMEEIARKGEVTSLDTKEPITARHLVWSDPALALAVSARSSARHGPRPLGEAIELLGEEAIRKRIFPAMLERIEHFRRHRHAVSTLYFQQSLTRAYLAYALGGAHGRRFAQNAYLAGLLLHVGKQALLVTLHDLSGSPMIPATAEINDFLDAYHPKVGAMLAERFGVPSEVALALREQKKKGACEPRTTVSCVVQLAEKIRRREVLSEDVLLNEALMHQLCATASSLASLREHVERKLALPFISKSMSSSAG